MSFPAPIRAVARVIGGTGANTHMAGQKKKRNHWVSQAYLRGFAADSGRKKIWTFSKNAGDPELLPIRNVAVRFYLYAPRGPQGRDYSFEEKLASLEQLFGSPHWTHISTGFVDLFALLAAVLYMRNPVQLAFTAEMHRAMVAFLSEHPELPEAMEIDGREIPLDIASWPAYRDADEDDIGRMWLRQVGSAAWLAQILLKMRWAVMVSDEPVFITTDNPMTPLHPELRFRGFRNPQTSIALPLSPTRLLWLDNRRSEPDGQYYPLKGNGASMNALLWRNAIEHMFSSRHTDQVCREMVEDSERGGFA